MSAASAEPARHASAVGGRPLLRLTLSIASAFATSVVATPLYADDAAVLREAREAELAGRAQAAYGTLSRAWEHERSVTLEAALGRAQLRLGMAREAAEHLSAALRAVHDTDPAWVDIVMDLASARRSVVTLRIETNTPGASILVDGESVGASPLGRDIFVDEGAHEVAAKLGRRTVSRSFHGSMGKVVDVALLLGPEEAAPAPAGPRAAAMAAAPAPASRKSVALVVAGTAVGVAGLATGGAFAVSAMTGHGDLESTNRSAATFLTAGALVLGATATYALWPARNGGVATPTRPVVNVALAGSAAGLSGRW